MLNIKKIQIAILFIATTFSVYSLASREIPIEPKSIKVEYYETSNRGVIYVYECEHCIKKQYEYKGKIPIVKRGVKISFDQFMKEYNSIEYPALMISPQSGLIVRVTY